MRTDLKLMRNKRASKIAHKRLSKASVFMKEQKKEAFFIEISQVIWGFVADKCNIQVSQLSMDSIRAELEKVDTDPQIISDFVTLLNDCEFARFAPGDPKDLMQQFYDRAFNAIITLEKTMKTYQKQSSEDSNKKVLLTLIFMSILFVNYAQVEPSFKKANDAYIAKKYEEATTQYQAIYEQGKTSAALCYNLGNCFFKQNEFAKSILWYERAKRLAPSDEDIDFNLNVARLKIIDKSDRVPVLFIVEWWNGFLHLFSASAWAWISIFVFLAFLSVLAVFLFSNSYLFRKTSFYGFIILFVLFAMSVIAAFNQRNSILNTSEIIVMQPTCNVKSSPDENSTLLFVVHEGLKAKIVDEIGEWIEIKLDNGTKGWVKKADAEVI
jgi:tetratricopeptide (TPR) repeat protein